MKLLDVIKQMIPLAKAISNYYKIELPKRFKQYPLIQEGENCEPPPEQLQLKALLDNQSDETIYYIQLLIECGQWEFTPSKFNERLTSITNDRNPNILADLMSRDLDLWLKLEDGLRQIRNLDIDKRINIINEHYKRICDTGPTAPRIEAKEVATGLGAERISDFGGEWRYQVENVTTFLLI